jgi:hypothetical protein
MPRIETRKRKKGKKRKRIKKWTRVDRPQNGFSPDLRENDPAGWDRETCEAYIRHADRAKELEPDRGHVIRASLYRIVLASSFFPYESRIMDREEFMRYEQDVKTWISRRYTLQCACIRAKIPISTYRHARLFFMGLPAFNFDKLTLEFLPGQLPGRPTFMLYGQPVHDLTGVAMVMNSTGLTIKDLARVCGYSHKAVIGWWKDGKRPSTRFIYALWGAMDKWKATARAMKLDYPAYEATDLIPDTPYPENT